VGLYTMADDLTHLPGTKISPVINMLVSPVMAELQTNIEALREALYRTIRLTAAIVVPMQAGIALLAEDIVVVLLGPKWLPTVPLIRLISLYATVRAIDGVLPPVMLARRRERFLFWYCLVLLIVMPAAAVLGTVWGGAAGLIAFYTVAYCAVMVILARETLLELRAKFSEIWSQTRPIMVATMAMIAIVLLVGELVAATPLDAPSIRLVLLSAVGAVSYGAVLFLIGSPVVGESAEVVGWILRRRSVNG